MKSGDEPPTNLFGDYSEQFVDIVQKLNVTRRHMWKWDYSSAGQTLAEIHFSYSDVLGRARGVLEQLRKDRESVDTSLEVEGEELDVNTSDERLFRKLARSRKTAFQEQPDLSLYLLGELTREADRLAEQVLGILPSLGMKELSEEEEKELKKKPSLNLLALRVESTQFEVDGLNDWAEKSHAFEYRVRRSGPRTVEVRATGEAPIDLSFEKVRERLHNRVGIVNTLGMEEGEMSESKKETQSGHLRFRVIGDLSLFDFSILNDSRVQGEVLPFESINDLDIIDEVFEALSG